MLLVLIVAVFLGIYLYISLTRHLSIGSYYFDLGIMHQAVSNTAHGHLFEMTDPNFYFQGHRLGYHFDPILALFAPAYMLFNNAMVLIIGQAVAVVSGAMAVYLLALYELKNKFYAVMLATSYLLYFPVQMTVIADYHNVTLATALLLWAFYWAETRRYKISYCAIVLAWLAKENVPLVTAGMGFYFFLKGRKKFGSSLMATSVLWFAIVYKVIMPYFRVGRHFAETYYTADIVVNLHRLFSPASFSYLFELLEPFLFVPLLAPQLLLIALPEWLINLLSANGNMRELQYHYTALLSPFILIATIYALKKVPHKKFFIILMLCANLYFSFAQGSFGKKYTPDVAGLQVIAKWQNILRDDNLPVATSGHLAPYFSGRRYFYNFFYDLAYFNQGITDTQIRNLAGHYEKAQYVLIKKSEVDPTDEKLLYYYFNLVSNPAYEKIADEAGIEVYKKKGL